MDTKQFVESDNVTIDLVKNSPSKQCVIISAGATFVDDKNKSRFKCLVEIDGQQKGFIPNKTTLRALQVKYGVESSAWMGKSISLSVGSVLGKEAIIGNPA
ncbi:hypothetical protein CMI37_14620 [Candidatus Pacearchaeota archaeon]|nr:hypothetical protein [Candidatus Pacearchaeota archaeon]